jgi:hypothetical protein
MHRDGRATEESSGQEDSTAVVMATAAGVAPRARKGMMAFIDAAQTWGGPTLRLKARAQGGSGRLPRQQRHGGACGRPARDAVKARRAHAWARHAAGVGPQTHRCAGNLGMCGLGVRSWPGPGRRGAAGRHAADPRAWALGATSRRDADCIPPGTV